MAIITLFSASYCKSDDIANLLTKRLGWKCIDNDLLAKTSQRFNISKEKLIQAMEGPQFLFNKFTHRREQYLAMLKIVLAEILVDKQIQLGFASHLIPKNIGHVLRVCLVSDMEYRAKQLKSETGISIDEALSKIKKEDQKRSQWTQKLFGTKPWDNTLYDLKIPVHDLGIDKTVELIIENANKDVMNFSDNSKQELSDFVLAAKCELALVEAGYLHTPSCVKGIVTVIIDEYVIMLERLESELKSLLGKIEGVKEVHIKTGSNYRPTSILTNIEFELPEKVLLVDDEKDFVLTLSERLEMRDLEPAIAYNGEEALTMIKEEEPDVMVLDLKMPGIDGIEVLRRVKAEHSEVEVIVLTGHGSDKDKELCMELGAFAYLEKPVDIEVLSDTMNLARKAIKSRQTKKK